MAGNSSAGRWIVLLLILGGVNLLSYLFSWNFWIY